MKTKSLFLCSMLAVGAVSCTSTAKKSDTQITVAKDTLVQVPTTLPHLAGPFDASDASLREYQYPEWFRDAKFGIWSHWGPQAVPRQGDWYAKNMYLQNRYDRKKKQFTGKPHPAYTYHVENYGHPSKFGFKDIIPLWKAERWDPDKLMQLYKRVGARYFVSMGVHHDNFYLWDSKQTPWTAVKMGPKKDVVGLWQKAAKKYGLPFGISEHLGASYTWYQDAHKADQTGEYKDVPYDANDPQYASLYHEKCLPGDDQWLTNNKKFQTEWLYRVKEVIDMYHPDLLYSDSKLPFEKIGRTMLAYYYNQDIRRNGEQNVVYTCKLEDSEGRYAKDYERGSAEGIQRYPWQTDTSIGDWYYRTGQKYMSGKEVIQMLIDIVSKNGNLLLNVVQTPEGDLEDEVLTILNEIADWMAINSEAIYGTRPWSVYGEGPSMQQKQAKGRFGGVKDVRDYVPGDLRFTRKGDTLYIFAMEHPEGAITVASMPKDAKVSNVSLLGSSQKITWKQDADGLHIEMPIELPSFATLVFKVAL